MSEIEPYESVCAKVGIPIPEIPEIKITPLTIPSINLIIPPFLCGTPRIIDFVEMVVTPDT